MGAADAVRRFYDAVNERQWDGAGDDFVAPDARLHIPAVGIETTGWEEGRAAVRDVIKNPDTHFKVEDVVEHGPFLVAFVTNTGSIDGQRMTWPTINVCRMVDGKAVEMWNLRGSDPIPVH